MRPQRPHSCGGAFPVGNFFQRSQLSPRRRPLLTCLRAMNQATERHEFQAEVKQLLDLMVHSLYSDKDIFLRELISNASDALDKLRFEQLTRTELAASDLHIRIEADRAQRTLAISDNGIGMTRDEVIKDIGTIARSGTREF